MKRYSQGIRLTLFFGGVVVSGLLTGYLLSQLSSVPDESALLDLAEAQASRVTPTGEVAPAHIDLTTPHPLSLEGIPPYPNATPHALARLTHVMGIPLSASWFSTDDSVENVMAFYQKQFGSKEHAGWHRDGDGIGYIAYREDQEFADGGVDSVLRMVTVVPQARSTLVMVSNSQPQELLEATPAVPAEVALPEGAVSPRVVETSALEGGGVTVSSSMNAELANVARSMRERLAAQGWSVDSRGAEGSSSLIATRNGARQVVWLEQREGAPTTIVVQLQPGGRP
jgi:hypothetical protein